MTAPMMPQGQPQQPPAPVQVPPLWTPFDELPIDTDPLVAALRQRKLGRVMATAAYARFSPRWQQELLTAYTKARQAVAMAQQAQAQAQQPQMHAAENAPPAPAAHHKPAAPAAPHGAS